MSLFGFIKDVALLPVEVVLDVTMITPTKRMLDDADDHKQPFGTVSRLGSIVDNLDETICDNEDD